MKEELGKLILAAKAIVYSDKQAQQFLPLIETQQGAADAVLAVIGAIEQRKPLEPQMVSMLAVNIYLMMVDVAMAATGEKPDKGIMKQTINFLLTNIQQRQQEAMQAAPQEGQQAAPAEQQPAPQQAPQGMIGAAA